MRNTLRFGARLLMLFALLLLITQLASAQRTILYCGRIIDPKSGQVSTGMSIVIFGNTISAVQKGYLAASPGDKVIDLKTRTVLPGLIDAHVHLEHETSPNVQLKGFKMSDVDIA